MTIKIHTAEDFAKMRSSGKLAAEVLDYITDFVRVGITTNELNRLCHEYITSNSAIPAPLNYRGFPKSICTSINHVVCHGIPDETKLRDGDILNIDVTVIVDGYHGDTSRMYYVGRPSIKGSRLIDITYEAMMRGISIVKPGATLGDIGHAIQSFVESNNYSVVRDYCGHGIGKVFHDEPNVVHYGEPGKGLVLQEGMFFTIEPMVNAGKHHTKLSHHDHWTVTTQDRSLSAQFEHTLGVTKDGFEIFTLSPRKYTKPPYINA
jgi:methionyl aminopeptidase